MFVLTLGHCRTDLIYAHCSMNEIQIRAHTDCFNAYLPGWPGKPVELLIQSSLFWAPSRDRLKLFIVTEYFMLNYAYLHKLPWRCLVGVLKLKFLHARCPSCHSVQSVKALKTNSMNEIHSKLFSILCIENWMLSLVHMTSVWQEMIVDVTTCSVIDAWVADCAAVVMLVVNGPASVSFIVNELLMLLKCVSQ